jgi:hypothetical protein
MEGWVDEGVINVRRRAGSGGSQLGECREVIGVVRPYKTKKNEAGGARTRTEAGGGRGDGRWRARARALCTPFGRALRDPRTTTRRAVFVHARCSSAPRTKDQATTLARWAPGPAVLLFCATGKKGALSYNARRQCAGVYGEEEQHSNIGAADGAQGRAHHRPVFPAVDHTTLYTCNSRGARAHFRLECPPEQSLSSPLHHRGGERGRAVSATFPIAGAEGHQRRAPCQNHEA